MIQTWEEDNNAEFTIALDNIIGLGELRLLRDLDLEIFDETATGTFTIGSEDVLKPDNVIALRSFHYTDASGSEEFLTRKSYDYIRLYWRNPSETGVPLYYTEFNETQWKVSPTPAIGSTYTVRYNARPAGLSPTNQNTFLSDNVADLLFKACIIEAEKYLKEDPSEGGRVSRFDAEYSQGVLDAKREFIRMQRADYRPIAPTTSPND